MASVNYPAILSGLKAILDADARLGGARVYIEEDPQFGLPELGKCIAIYLTRRSLHPNQPLNAGKTTRWLLEMSIWTFGFSLEHFPAAVGVRDTLLQQLELVLQENRTISGNVTTSWMGGGDFLSARNPDNSAFVAGAETTLIADVAVISA